MLPKINQLSTLTCLFQLVFFTFFLTSSNTTYAQSGNTFVKARKGIAYTNVGKKIRFRKMKETENSFIFTTTNKTDIELEKFKIAKIKKRKGTRGFQYAMTTIGGTCLFVAHSAYLYNFHSLGRFRSSYDGEVLFIAIILSAFTGTLGGLVGVNIPRYKTIYSADGYGRYEPNLNLKTSSPNAIPSLTLSYTF